MAKRNKEEQKIYDEYVKDLKGHESYRSEVYPDGKDSEGRQLYSVGYGHQLTPEELLIYPPGSKVPKKVTDGWFKADADKYYELGKAEVAQYGRTDAAAIKGAANAMYNLGEAGFAGFKDMRQAMTEGRWGDVEKYAKDSKWFKEDAPTRTQYFVDNMLSPYERDAKGNVVVPQKVEQPGQVAPVKQIVKPIPNGAIQEEPIVGETMPKEESKGILGTVKGWGSNAYDWLDEKTMSDEEKAKIARTELAEQAGRDAIDNPKNFNPFDHARRQEEAIKSGNTNDMKALGMSDVEVGHYAPEQEETGIDWAGSLSDAFRNIGQARDKKQAMLSNIPRASNFSGSVKADLAGLQGVLNARATQFQPYATKFGG